MSSANLSPSAFLLLLLLLLPASRSLFSQPSANFFRSFQELKGEKKTKTKKRGAHFLFSTKAALLLLFLRSILSHTLSLCVCVLLLSCPQNVGLRSFYLRLFSVGKEKRLCEGRKKRDQVPRKEQTKC